MTSDLTSSAATATIDVPQLEDVTARLRLAVMRLARRLRQEASEGLTPSMLSVLASISRAQPGRRRPSPRPSVA